MQRGHARVRLSASGDRLQVPLRLLADGVRSFNEHCAVGIEPNEKEIRKYLEHSLMLVTALNPLLRPFAGTPPCGPPSWTSTRGHVDAKM